MIPNDQISHFAEYYCFSNIWGAIYIGLPTQVFKAVVGSLITLEKPKSQILNKPL